MERSKNTRSTTAFLKERTLGDGMDNSLLTLAETSIKLDTKRAKTIQNSLKPVEAKPPIKMLIPKYVPKERTQNKYLFHKQKEPKFVPYEPYKCCMEPIVKNNNIKKKLKKEIPKVEKISKSNNVDINNLVEQMSEMRASELSKATIEAIHNDDVFISKKQWENEKNALKTDIKNLRETNAHLENQLKFQAQVNGELKTLLVAAVGEDLETRVQHLTEDKLQLARALLNSANHLTSHQEQTEWLSGQCEVWRSKFLASSLMVEELARWKSALMQRVHEFQENTKCLLEERNKVYNTMVKMQHVMLDVLEQLGGNKTPTRNDGILTLSENNLGLIQTIASVLNVDSKEKNHVIVDTPKFTPTEKAVHELLRNPVSLPTKPDAVCSAVMGAAMQLSGGQLYLQHPSSHATCCKHCMGEVQEM